MAEPLVAVEDDEEDVNSTVMSRKEKRKELKKKKRREKRRELAEKEREEEEARLNDPEELKRMALIEEEERLIMEKEKIEFEERERIWLEKIRKEDEEQEERWTKKLLDDSEIIKDDDNEEGSDWEYAEEGPAEIIWQGNEIIVKKKKVRVSKKKNVEQHPIEEDADRPTSNPLPPQFEVFSDYKNASIVSAHEIYDNVAQQVPNFGTEQDKSHCPFHIKTGACRFGQRCSRVHFYPDKSCTLLIKNMYNGPGLAWEQDEGLEYTDEEVERCYEEFYEDVHTEFLKFGEVVNFKVCKNGCFHLRGNVYVHYKSLDSAMLAYQYINGRYFAGKLLTCEYVGVTKWKIAICGEYMRSRLKTCSRGTACNFIHCFRNPGGDYEWADWDKHPPRYWVKKMTALFGYSDEFTQTGTESLCGSRSSGQILPAEENSKHRSRRSKSRETDGSSSRFGRCHDEKNGQRNSPYCQKHKRDGRKGSKVRDEKKREDRTNCNDFHYHKGEFHDTDSDRDSDHRDTDRYGLAKKRSRRHNHVLEFKDDYGDNRSRTLETDSDEYISDIDMERDTRNGRKRKSSRHGKKENHNRRRKTSNDIDSSQKNNSKENEEVSDLSDDHGENKNMIIESDRERDFSEKKKVNEISHERSRKGTRHRHRGSRDLKDHDGMRKRGHDTDSSGDWSARNRGGKKTPNKQKKKVHKPE